MDRIKGGEAYYGIKNVWFSGDFCKVRCRHNVWTTDMCLSVCLSVPSTGAGTLVLVQSGCYVVPSQSVDNGHVSQCVSGV